MNGGVPADKKILDMFWNTNIYKPTRPYHKPEPHKSHSLSLSICLSLSLCLSVSLCLSLSLLFSRLSLSLPLSLFLSLSLPKVRSHDCAPVPACDVHVTIMSSWAVVLPCLSRSAHFADLLFSFFFFFFLPALLLFLGALRDGVHTEVGRGARAPARQGRGGARARVQHLLLRHDRAVLSGRRRRGRRRR